jgi:glycosyltransferase involved in cell wall biosynthesis
MKILVLTPYLGTTYGGTSKCVKELVAEVGRIGTKVDLISTNANGDTKLDIPLHTWIKQDTYRLRYFPCWHKGDFIISFSLISWLIREIAHYDIVHTNTVFAPLISFAHWLCRLREIPYIATPHGMLEPWALSYKSYKKQLYYHLIEKPVLQRASAIQTLGCSESKNIRSLGFNQTVIISNGVHRQEFENLPSPDFFYQQFPETRNQTLILFLARIDPKKGLDLLAPAFAKVQAQFRETHLVVAGPDSVGFLPTAQSYFSQLGCLQAVTFTGMLTGSLKDAALGAASLYVAPSYSEGFSMSVLEGMASGLPCVITTGCNFPEAGEAQAAHVVDINADEIADALIQFLSNPQQAKAMGAIARQLIFEHYTWDKIAAKLSATYEAILLKQ